MKLLGCADCSASENGCCPDQFTAASGPEGQGCDCAGSEFGCCPDGETAASGPSFDGCTEIPGEICGMPKPTGGQSRQNLTVKWFFNTQFGSCSRFWYSETGNEDNEKLNM